jgi:hypothetical protein
MDRNPAHGGPVAQLVSAFRQRNDYYGDIERFAERATVKTDAIVHEHATHCLNCGAAVHASFCQFCGQGTAVHVPSAREFLHEFVGHYVALESTLWRTLALLLFKPGRLTRDYIEGKRVRYVLPLRVYLTMSLIFFAVFKYQGHGNETDAPSRPQAQAGQQADNKVAQKAKADDGEADNPEATLKGLDEIQTDLDEVKKTTGLAGAPGVAIGQLAVDAARQKAQAKAAAAKPKGEAGNPNEFTITSTDNDTKRSTTYSLVDKNTLQAKLDAFNLKIGEKYAKFDAKTRDEKWHQVRTGLLGYAPYAIFLMMPFFALYLKLLYLGSGRRYGEHLLFALHTNAFAFLMLILVMVLPAIPYLRPALVLWLTFYLPTAMRKVYGGSRKATFARWMVLMGLHLLGMTLAMLGALALTIMAG